MRACGDGRRRGEGLSEIIAVTGCGEKNVPRTTHVLYVSNNHWRVLCLIYAEKVGSGDGSGDPPGSRKSRVGERGRAHIVQFFPAGPPDDNNTTSQSVLAFTIITQSTATVYK